MKKIVLWLMSTLTAVVLLFGYHTSTSSQASAEPDSSQVAPIGGSAAGTTTAPSASGSSTGSAAAGSTSAATGTSGTGTSGTGTSSTVTGTAASTRYGPVQVQLTVSGGTITDVSVVEYPDNSGKDQQINARALPVLVQETLAAQSASIDMVSGATYTSDGYVTSLQSALDEAGL